MKHFFHFTEALFRAALATAIDETDALPNTTGLRRSSTSDPMTIFRQLNNRATGISQQQGQSRLEVEQILKTVSRPRPILRTVSIPRPSFSPADLVRPRFSPSDSVRSGFSPGDLVRLGFSPGDVVRPGFSPGDVVRPGFSPGDLVRLGFSPGDLVRPGLVRPGLERPSFSPGDIEMPDIQTILDASDCNVANVNCRKYSILLYRTNNGTCNNLFFPLNGATQSSFTRLLPADYEDGIAQPNGFQQAISGDPFSGPWPSARHVSQQIVKDLEVQSEELSAMFLVFGQFVDHDLDIAPIFDLGDFECGCNFTNRCLPILVNPADPVFGNDSPHMGQCLTFTRSIPACRVEDNILQRNQINQINSYIDASNVYGSDDELARNLRLGIGGFLKQSRGTQSNKGNLPFGVEKSPMNGIPFFVAGDQRSNEQLPLTVMHTIWMREHNRIAKELARVNPCWGDEKLYQETRKIVGGIMQVIVYTEFLPVLFGKYFNEYIPKFTGYNPFVDATIPNEFAAAAFRFGHSLVPPFIVRLDENYLPVAEGPLPLERAFFNPIEYFKSNGTDPILRGLLASQSRVVDEFLNNVLTSKLFTSSPETLGSDLASLNIQRGRDHGLASYRKWQEFCHRFFHHKDVTFDRSYTERKLREIYGEQGFREGMDLWVGGLAEKKLRGSNIGPTFACIFALTFTKVRDGDRFWYQNPFIFRSRQVRELEKASLSKVICNNADNITEIQPNAFQTNQARVPCDRIKDINLWHWIDRKCYNYN